MAFCAISSFDRHGDNGFQTDTIHHEAETHEEDIKEKRWVEDTAAYDETVITGYTCSCGATK